MGPAMTEDITRQCPRLRSVHSQAPAALVEIFRLKFVGSAKLFALTLRRQAMNV